MSDGTLFGIATETMWMVKVGKLAARGMLIEPQVLGDSPPEEIVYTDGSGRYRQTREMFGFGEMGVPA